MSDWLYLNGRFLGVGRRKEIWKLPELIFTIVLALLVGGSVAFGIGVKVFSDNATLAPPAELTQDASFYILVSQSLINILTTACTLASVIKQDFWKGVGASPEVAVSTCLSAVFAIIAPAVYTGGGAVEIITQANGMVFSFCSSVCAVLAAMFAANLTNP